MNETTPKEIEYWPNGALVELPEKEVQLWSYDYGISVNDRCPSHIKKLLKSRRLFDTKERAGHAMEVAQKLILSKEV